MDFDDIVYVSLLIFSIVFGYYYRTIQQVDEKKKIGSIVGFIIVFIVSGFHIIHPIVFVLVNALIILYMDKRKCHVVSFVFSFLYLFFFRTTIHFGIPYPPAHTNLIQMVLTLKLVGLAFELNTSYTSKKQKDTGNKTKEEQLQTESIEFELTFIEIFHYAFNYIGVLTGPYFRYRTFRDLFERPFAQFVDWKTSTFNKLKYVPLYAALFMWGTYNWPLKYALTDEFFEERSWLYRYWYIWPNFFNFRMRIYIGLILAECACTVAGLGAYPTFSKPKPGEGPSDSFEKMKSLTRKELETVEYNYETIHNINPWETEFCTTYREAMKHWNICIQYWLAVNVHRRFPIKSIRIYVTLLVSALWHGIYTGHYVCIATVPFVLLVEDVWVKILLKNKENVSKVTEWTVWFFRTQMFSYQAIAFSLLQLGPIIKYYNSVYHVCLFMYIILYGIGFYILKSRRTPKTEREQREKNK